MNAAEPNRFTAAIEYFESPQHHLEKVEEHDESSGIGTWIGDDGTVEALNKFDGGAILVDAIMGGGCKPLFTLRFMPGPEHREMMWGESITLSSSVAVVDDPGDVASI